MVIALIEDSKNPPGSGVGQGGWNLRIWLQLGEYRHRCHVGIFGVDVADFGQNVPVAPGGLEEHTGGVPLIAPLAHHFPFLGFGVVDLDGVPPWFVAATAHDHQPQLFGRDGSMVMSGFPLGAATGVANRTLDHRVDDALVSVVGFQVEGGAVAEQPLAPVGIGVLPGSVAALDRNVGANGIVPSDDVVADRGIPLFGYTQLYVAKSPESRVAAGCTAQLRETPLM